MDLITLAFAKNYTDKQIEKAFISGDGDGETEVVRVLFASNGDGTYTPDKSYSEVAQAYGEGKSVHCLIEVDGSIYILPLCNYNQEQMFFVYGGASANLTIAVVQNANGYIGVFNQTLATNDDIKNAVANLATNDYVDNAIANLPTGAPQQMELIASGTNTEPVRRFKITVDNDGNPFELTKMYLAVRNIATNGTDSNNAVFIQIDNPNTGLSVYLTNIGTMQTEAKNKDVIAYANQDGLFMGAQGEGGIYALGASKYSTIFNPNQTFTMVNFSCAAAGQTFQAGATYELWGIRK